jgi:hypothetical protein
MSSQGHLKIGCRNHGVIANHVRESHLAKQIREKHAENHECMDYEIDIQDIGFYDHSSREPEDTGQAEKILNDILDESDSL